MEKVLSKFYVFWVFAEPVGVLQSFFLKLLDFCRRKNMVFMHVLEPQSAQKKIKLYLNFRKNAKLYLRDFLLSEFPKLLIVILSRSLNR